MPYSTLYLVEDSTELRYKQWLIVAVPETTGVSLKVVDGDMHLVDQAPIPRLLQRCDRHWQGQWKSAKLHCTLAFPYLWCNAYDKRKSRGNFEIKFNQLSLYIPPEKELSPADLETAVCLRTSKGGKVFTSSCCDCASLAPNFIRVFKCICQTLPNSHTGLAIRIVWRKWCGLGIWSGLCCYSRNDARACMRL